MKKYAFFDIDNTIYDGYITSGFYLFLADRKLVPDFVYEKDKEISRLYYSGKIDYAEGTRRVVKLMAQILKGKRIKAVDKWQKDFIINRNRLFPWVDKLFSLLKKKNYVIYLISAAASPSVEAVTDFLGIKKFFSSNLVIKNGVYTGETENILNYEEKKKLIHRIIGHLGKCKRVGFGDSSGDIDMLSSVDIAFLYNPQSKDLKRIAEEKGWHIVNKKNILKTVKSKI